MIKYLSVLLVCLSVSACSGKGGNRAEDVHFNDLDYTIQCLYGFKYLVRIAGTRAYMAPKFDPATSLPEKCE